MSNDDKKQDKLFSDTTRTQRKKPMSIKLKDDKGNWIELNEDRDKWLDEHGYTGDREERLDNNELIFFMLKNINSELSKNLRLLKKEVKKLKAQNANKPIYMNPSIFGALTADTTRKKPMEMKEHNLLAVKERVYLLKDNLVQGCNLNSDTSHLLSTSFEALARQIDHRGVNYNRVVKINIEQYLQRIGEDLTKRDTKKNFKRKAFYYALTLESIKLARLNNEDKWEVSTIIDKVACEKNTLTISFATSFVEDLQQGGFISYYNQKLYLLKGNALSIGLTMQEHYYKNVGKKGSTTLKVATLLKHCDNIPSKEKIRDRHYKNRIIEPFEKALLELENNKVITWQYKTDKGLNDEEQKQLESKTVTSFSLFEKLSVKFDLIDKVDQTERVREYKARQRKIAEKVEYAKMKRCMQK